jgi:uncharacterized glyoxalase superfamily protein PhnB
MADSGLKLKLRSAVPVFLVGDIASTMEWYQRHLEFEVHTFPDRAPYAFCVLINGGVEIMLQALAGYEKRRDFERRVGGVWDAYLRVDGVVELYEAMSRADDVKMLEPIKRQSYGDTEFVVEDPNGYVLVFGEQVKSAG